MKSRISAVITLLLSSLVFAVTPASAGPVCNLTPGTAFCGQFEVSSTSQSGIGGIPNWGPDWNYGFGGGWWQQPIVNPGQWSPWPDTDGFWTGDCYRTRVDERVASRFGVVYSNVGYVYGPANWKIVDGKRYRLKSERWGC